MWPMRATWIAGCMMVYLTLNAYVHGTSSLTEDENKAINYFRKIISPVRRINKGAIRSIRPKKSRKPTYSLLILNSSPATLGEFPWMAGLIFHRTNFKDESNDWYCGGALIKPDIVLTGANVASNNEYKAWKVIVVLGSLTLGTGDTRIESRDIITHHNFASIHNDIAIIRLPSPVKLSKYIQPIELPSRSQLNESFVGEIAVAAGYGFINEENRRPHLDTPLNSRKMLVLENNVCQKLSPVMTENLICTKVAEAKDNDKISNTTICLRDCGGPLFVYKNKEPILIGVMVFGACRAAEKQLDLYTRVTSYINWIHNTIGDHEDNNTATITNTTDYNENRDTSNSKNNIIKDKKTNINNVIIDGITNTDNFSNTNIKKFDNINNINGGQNNINIIENINKLKKKQKNKKRKAGLHLSKQRFLPKKYF